MVTYTFMHSSSNIYNQVSERQAKKIMYKSVCFIVCTILPICVVYEFRWEYTYIYIYIYILYSEHCIYARKLNMGEWCNAIGFGPTDRVNATSEIINYRRLWRVPPSFRVFSGPQLPVGSSIDCGSDRVFWDLGFGAVASFPASIVSVSTRLCLPAFSASSVSFLWKFICTDGVKTIALTAYST